MSHEFRCSHGNAIILKSQYENHRIVVYENEKLTKGNPLVVLRD